MPDAAAPVPADDPLAVAEAWMGEGRDLAIATVVRATGTAFPTVGRRLVLAGDGAVCGSLAAGGIEEAVIAAAAGVIATGKPRLLDFDAEGGHACVYVERLG